MGPNMGDLVLHYNVICILQIPSKSKNLSIYFFKSLDFCKKKKKKSYSHAVIESHAAIKMILPNSLNIQ